MKALVAIEILSAWAKGDEVAGATLKSSPGPLLAPGVILSVPDQSSG
jgi:hypothetical protein